MSTEDFFNIMTYVIFDTSEVNKIDFTEVAEKSINDCVKSLDGNKAIVKWLNSQPEPSFLSNIVTKSQLYDRDEIVAILQTSDWNGNVSGVK